MKHSMRLSILLVGLTAVLLPPAVHAECAVAWYVPRLITPAGHTLSSDGALLVALDLAWGRAEERPTTTVDFPPMALTRGRRRIPLRVEVLSGTLARYVPEETPSPGRYRVEGLGDAEVRFGAALATPLPSPRLRAVGRAVHEGIHGAFLELRATLSSAPPSGALLLLLRRGRNGFGWKLLEGDDTELVIPLPGGCAPAPRAAAPVPRVGAEVIFRYFDANGREGQRSTATMGALPSP